MARDVLPDGVAKADREKSSPLKPPNMSASQQCAESGIPIRRTNSRRP
jgi:hypothetical protein